MGRRSHEEAEQRHVGSILVRPSGSLLAVRRWRPACSASAQIPRPPDGGGAPERQEVAVSESLAPVRWIVSVAPWDGSQRRPTSADVFSLSEKASFVVFSPQLLIGGRCQDRSALEVSVEAAPPRYDCS